MSINKIRESVKISTVVNEDDCDFKDETKEDKILDSIQKGNQIGRYKAFFGVVFSALLVSLVGTLSGFTNYITSYYPDSNDKSTSSFYPIMTVVYMFGNIMGLKVIQARFKWWHPRMQYIVILILLASKEYIGSIQNTVIGFEFTWVPLTGFTYGYMAMTPIYMALLYFPERKSAITGFSTSVRAIATAGNIYLQAELMNPSPSISSFSRPTEPEALKTYKQFPLYIASNLQQTMRTYGFIYIAFALFIFCIFPNYPLKNPDADPLNEAEIKKLLRDDGVDRSSVFTTHEEEEEDLVNPDKQITTMEILKTKQFWILYFMMISFQLGNSFFASNFRVAFSPTINDEDFITLVSSVTSAFGCLGFIWAIMLERFNFKVAFGLVLFVSSTIALVCPAIMELDGQLSLKKAVFMIGSVGQTFVNIGQSMLYMLSLVKIYGTEGGMKAYAVAVTYTLVYGIFSFIYSKLVYNPGHISYQVSSTMFAVPQIISLIMLWTVFKGSKTKND